MEADIFDLLSSILEVLETPHWNTIFQFGSLISVYNIAMPRLHVEICKE